MNNIIIMKLAIIIMLFCLHLTCTFVSFQLGAVAAVVAVLHGAIASLRLRAKVMKAKRNRQVIKSELSCLRFVMIVVVLQKSCVCIHRHISLTSNEYYFESRRYFTYYMVYILSKYDMIILLLRRGAF